MNRAFLTLYSFIVVSVISIGWGLDQLWRYYKPAEDISTVQRDFVRYIARQLAPYQTQQAANKAVTKFQHELDSQLSLLPLDALAHSSMYDRLMRGESVLVSTSRSTSSVYQKIDRRDWLLVVDFSQKAESSTFYYVLIILFYACIALAVFFWVWPLSRDLRKLERQTKRVGKDNVPLDLDIHPGSTVYALSVSFQKMVERIRELISSHKEMTYAVSHELRTPLARMKFALEMAADAKKMPDIKQQLLGVREDVSDMDSLVTQLLAYAGYEQDDIELNLEAGSVNVLVSHLIEELRKNVYFSHVHIDFDDRLAGKEVVCEWHLMERAIINLMQNAQRFAVSTIKVSATYTEKNFVICVEDDGPGIPEEEYSRVFQSFVRLSSKENSTVRGFGLGLAIVKRIVDWHKGSVQAGCSNLGGALFVVRWPDVQAS